MRKEIDNNKCKSTLETSPKIPSLGKTNRLLFTIAIMLGCSTNAENSDGSDDSADDENSGETSNDSDEPADDHSDSSEGSEDENNGSTNDSTESEDETGATDSESEEDSTNDEEDPTESSGEGDQTSETTGEEESSIDDESSDDESSDDETSDDGTNTDYERVVAIGDIHGDLDALHKVLEVAGLVDETGKWTAKNTLIVQTGDLIDRGDDDRAILEEIEERILEAEAAGSRFVVLNGNHEIINSESDFRYVTEGAWAQFDGIDPQGPFADKVDSAPEREKGRMAAFLPGGVFALRLADRPIVTVLAESIFVHGGLTPGYAEYGIDKINSDSYAWLRGELPTIPQFAHGDDCPIWTRYFSDSEAGIDCEMLDQTLAIVGAKRMIVGHSVHTNGITSYCDDKVWVIDVGMSAYYGGTIEALELIDGDINVLD